MTPALPGGMRSAVAEGIRLRRRSRLTVTVTPVFRSVRPVCRHLRTTHRISRTDRRADGSVFAPVSALTFAPSFADTLRLRRSPAFSGSMSRSLRKRLTDSAADRRSLRLGNADALTVGIGDGLIPSVGLGAADALSKALRDTGCIAAGRGSRYAGGLTDRLGITASRSRSL